ncbi:MAG: peptidylprolyl isomerase [Alphaproteobacteria bacterium]|nr:peptidylprolyl isomerase [Alphaproteobacteria bacterium]
MNKIAQSGNAVIIVLVALVVVAVGAFAYLSSQKVNEQSPLPSAEVATAASAEPQTSPAHTAEEKPPEAEVLAPGNPVVAKVGGEDITRQDVMNFVQTLPDQLRQMPLEKIFPLAQEQVINARIIAAKTKGVSVDSDAEYQKQLALAKEQITRSVYIQNEVDKNITEEKLQTAYEKYRTEFPKTEERKASHILVDSEEKAKELIEKIKAGSDFSTLAKENSKDNTAQSGGDLGYFAKDDVVPEFAAAAFGMQPGQVSDTPVKTQFGWHVIKLEDRRDRPPGDFDSVKPFLEAQLRREVLDNLIKTWRTELSVERFDINGNKIEPAAGTTTQPAAGAAPAAAPAP